MELKVRSVMGTGRQCLHPCLHTLCAAPPADAAHSLSADMVTSRQIMMTTGRTMIPLLSGAGGLTVSRIRAVDTLGGKRSQGSLSNIKAPDEKSGNITAWLSILYCRLLVPQHASHMILSATGSRKAPKTVATLSCME